jgi:hypothetical protein
VTFGRADHGDNPERYPDPLNLQSLGGAPACDDLAHRIGEGGYVVQTPRDTAQPLLVE